jgi:hypothetical protein
MRRRSALGALRRQARAWFLAVARTAGGIVRIFGWLYIAVLVPALVVSGYLAVREASAGGDVWRSLYLVPLAMIWPIAAIALRREGPMTLPFPLNAVLLLGAVSLVLLGWTVVIRAVRNVFRWRAAR